MNGSPITEAALAECCRLTGTDPTRLTDTGLATFATTEVRRLRTDADTLGQQVEKLTAAIRTHRRATSSPTAADARLYAALDPVEDFLADHG